MTSPRRLPWHDGWLELDAGPPRAAAPAPVTLTLETGPGCPLACGYCYARTRPARAGELADAAVAAAARLVAEHARREHRPMLLGLHGAGEPLRELERLERVSATVRGQAARVGVSLQLAATTSGVVSDA
ncbi:MAG TPA: radical SAM protein, partial [Polyangiaceae bacterium]|nr:radical SAM protein [Polyangiaceae bacterium]